MSDEKINPELKAEESSPTHEEVTSPTKPIKTEHGARRESVGVNIIQNPLQVRPLFSLTSQAEVYWTC